MVEKQAVDMVQDAAGLDGFDLKIPLVQLAEEIILQGVLQEAETCLQHTAVA